MNILLLLSAFLLVTFPPVAHSGGLKHPLPDLDGSVVRIDGQAFEGLDNFRTIEELMRGAGSRVRSGIPVARSMANKSVGIPEISRNGCVPEHTLSFGSGPRLKELVFGRIQPQANIEKTFNRNGWALSRADRQGRFAISTNLSNGRNSFVLFDKVSGKILSISLKIQ
jgi:hypothetical protein